MNKVIRSLAAMLGRGDNGTVESDLSALEQAIQTARHSDDFMPVWERFVNTDFFVLVDQRDSGSQTRDFRFVISTSPKDEPAVLISEDIEKLSGRERSQAINMSGGRLIEVLNPEVSILVVISDGGFGMPVDLVAWLRQSMQAVE